MTVIVYQKLKRLSGSITKPGDYLEFARKDALLNDRRGFINAIKNSKAAIDAQLDVLLEVYGLLGSSSHWPFPRKIDVIRRIGLVSPQILNRVNELRVQIEHYHEHPPERQEVLNMLDLAEVQY